MKAKNTGWTLLELMIALVLMAVLVAVAYPAYNEQIIKSRRADGMAMLFQAAQRQQQHYTVYQAFTSTAGAGGLEMSATSTDGYYALSIVADATSYTLMATPLSPQTADARCGKLTLNHFGVKGNVDGTRPADECW